MNFDRYLLCLCVSLEKVLKNRLEWRLQNPKLTSTSAIQVIRLNIPMKKIVHLVIPENFAINITKLFTNRKIFIGKNIEVIGPRITYVRIHQGSVRS